MVPAVNFQALSKTEFHENDVADGAHLPGSRRLRR